VHPRRAWLSTAVAFAAMFVSVGTGFSYGALVLPVSRDLGIGQGAAAGVFAVTIMVFFLAGAPAGMISDRIGSRWVLLLGGVALVAGLVTTSRADGAVGLYLGHGVLVGLAMASTFIPLTVVVSSSFDRHRSLALGIAVSGIGLGTLVMAPLIAYLIRTLGWREAYLALAVGCGAVLLVGTFLVSRPRLPAHHAHGPPLGDALRSRTYLLLYAAQALVSVAIFTPFSHLPAYAEQAGIDAVRAAGLVGVIGAASVIGRLTLGPVADRVGLLQTYRLCFVAIGVSFGFWLWPAGPSYGVLAVHAAILGVGYGGFVALVPGVLAERFGLRQLGGLLGIIYTSHVIGAGLGPLMTGLLIERHGYLPAGWVALTCALAAIGLLGLAGSRRMPQPAAHGAGDPDGGGAGQARPSRR